MPDGFLLQHRSALSKYRGERPEVAVNVGRPSNGMATRAEPFWCVMATEYQADADAARYLSRWFDVRQFVIQAYRPAFGKRPAGFVWEAAFPGYLILRLGPDDPRQHLRADSRNGVAGLLTAVGDKDSPAILPDAAMLVLLGLAQDNLWAGTADCLGRLDRKGYLGPIPKPADMFPDLTGRLMEIEDHPLMSGLQGTCVASSKARLSLLTEAMGLVVVPRAKARPV